MTFLCFVGGTEHQFRRLGTIGKEKAIVPVVRGGEKGGGGCPEATPSGRKERSQKSFFLSAAPRSYLWILDGNESKKGGGRHLQDAMSLERGTGATKV